MSHLLYLHSVPWERFAPLLGKGKKPSAPLDVEARAKKLGIKPTAISPMGIGAPMLDAYERHFKKRKAQALLAQLRNEATLVLFAPDEVAIASTTLAGVAELGDDDDFAEEFVSELVEPFAAVAKKQDRGIYGRWS